jgi:hypothetical protein
MATTASYFRNVCIAPPPVPPFRDDRAAEGSIV